MMQSDSNVEIQDQSPTQDSMNSQYQWIFVFVVLGCLSRLLWADDMKWKGDEIWMYEMARDVVTGQRPWPWLGMPTSTGFLNPGLSVWCFIAFAWVSTDPVTMVRMVQGLNIVAIVLFILWIMRHVPKSERIVWLWGIAIMSVNPLAIHFSRSFWANDVLPFFGFFVFAGHWFRNLKWGAGAWGLAGTLIGQVHPSGLFWQASLVIVSLWKYRTSTRWNWCALGSAIGFLPMIPWILHMSEPAGTVMRPSWAEILTPNFPLHWLLSSWGLNLEYELGSEFWRSFLQEPRIMGYPSFGATATLLFLAVSAIAAIVRWVRSRQIGRVPDLKNQNLIDHKPTYELYLWASGVIMPVLFLLARVRIPAHYLIVIYPFIHIWVAVLERNRPRSLIAICSAQLLISICFLVFIHIHNGGPEAYYGLVYRLHPVISR